MELKLAAGRNGWRHPVLLIVPYGIETLCCLVEFLFLLVLLIVPYGIETRITPSPPPTSGLLIVPYGIETS